MQFLFNTMLVLHFVGIASLLGSAIVQAKPPRSITPGYLHGALTMLVTGLALVGLTYPLGGEPDNAKVAVKLAVLIVILVLVFVNRAKEQISTGVWASIASLTTLNIILAVFWT
ncbi:MAG: hypothetical protein CMH41_09025 [Micrococcales bacterium]|nr:hypothetical protein [Micrococcales bacterium]